MILLLIRRSSVSIENMILLHRVILFFFFFQAEDGIRDYKVTGVQTCALPIIIYRNSVRLNEPYVYHKFPYDPYRDNFPGELSQFGDRLQDQLQRDMLEHRS